MIENPIESWEVQLQVRPRGLRTREVATPRDVEGAAADLCVCALGSCVCLCVRYSDSALSSSRRSTSSSSIGSRSRRRSGWRCAEPSPHMIWTRMTMCTHQLEHEGAESEARWEMKRIELIKVRGRRPRSLIHPGVCTPLSLRGCPSGSGRVEASL